MFISKYKNDRNNKFKKSVFDPKINGKNVLMLYSFTI